MVVANLDKIDCEILLKVINGENLKVSEKEMFTFIKQDLEETVKETTNE